MYVQPHEAGGPSTVSEVTLFRQTQAGCHDNLNWLMARDDGLDQAVVRRQVLGDLPLAEALQAGRIGVWCAILGFAPCHGLAFSNYTWPCIKHQVGRRSRCTRVSIRRG